MKMENKKRITAIAKYFFLMTNLPKGFVMWPPLPRGGHNEENAAALDGRHTVPLAI